MKQKENKTPEWAKKLDDLGKKTWKPEKRNKKGEYLASIIANIFVLYIINNLLNWNVPFLTESFVAVTWVWNITITVTIIGNILLFIKDDGWFYHLIQIIINSFGFIGLYVLLVLFPFDFSKINFQYTNQIAIIVFIIGLIATFFTIVGNVFGLIIDIFNNKN